MSISGPDIAEDGSHVQHVDSERIHKPYDLLMESSQETVVDLGSGLLGPRSDPQRCLLPNTHPAELLPVWHGEVSSNT